MLAGQTSVGSNGFQNALFPFDEMYITQGEDTPSGSHYDMLAIDFVGWANGHQVDVYPYYAPFDCTLVAKFGGTMLCWQSNQFVNYIDGTTGIMTIGFGHDNDYDTFTVGETRHQGDLIGHTGIKGASGYHCHMEVVRGPYANFIQIPETGYYKMINSIHIYNALGVDDTIMYRPLNYNWRTFGTPPTPVERKLSKFPWVLYARKLRNKRQLT